MSQDQTSIMCHFQLKRMVHSGTILYKIVKGDIPYYVVLVKSDEDETKTVQMVVAQFHMKNFQSTVGKRINEIFQIFQLPEGLSFPFEKELDDTPKPTIGALNAPKTLNERKTRRARKPRKPRKPLKPLVIKPSFDRCKSPRRSIRHSPLHSPRCCSIPTSPTSPKCFSPLRTPRCCLSPTSPNNNNRKEFSTQISCFDYSEAPKLHSLDTSSIFPNRGELLSPREWLKHQTHLEQMQINAEKNFKDDLSISPYKFVDFDDVVASLSFEPPTTLEPNNSSLSSQPLFQPPKPPQPLSSFSQKPTTSFENVDVDVDINFFC